MNKAILAALLVAAPGFALAQATGSQTQPIPNQANPQVQANEAMQPQNAHQVESGPGLGQADAMPTPALNQPMTKIGNQPVAPHSDPIR